MFRKQLACSPVGLKVPPIQRQHVERHVPGLRAQVTTICRSCSATRKQRAAELREPGYPARPQVVGRGGERRDIILGKVRPAARAYSTSIARPRWQQLQSASMRDPSSHIHSAVLKQRLVLVPFAQSARRCQKVTLHPLSFGASQLRGAGNWWCRWREGGPRARKTSAQEDHWLQP